MDDDFGVTLSGDLSDWLEALPEYQRRTVTQMLEGSDPIAVSLAWLSSTGPSNTEPFGAIRNAPNLFYDNLLSQLQSLLCKKEHEKERHEILSNAKTSRAAIITAISDYVAPHLHASPILLAPAVAMTIAVLANAGGDSFCATLSQLIEDRKTAASKK